MSRAEFNMKASLLVSGSEVEPKLRRERPRRDEVGSAERGQEVVKRDFVGQVDDGEAEAPLVTVFVEQFVISQADVKQVPRSDSRWIAVIVRRP